MSLSEFSYPPNEGNIPNFYKEIWDGSEYDRFDIRVEKDDLVVDCGANIGLFTQYAISKGAKQVYSFECDDNYFNYLKQNTQSNSNITIYKGVVSDRDKDWNIPKIVDNVTMGKRINFLKVDIEGWEYPTLINCPNEYLNMVDKIAIEVHFNHDTTKSRTMDLMEKLSKCGFRLSYEHIHKTTKLGMIYGIK
tara:strand:+ start:40 stop:615 length:576 start_codon:yes stop_codon:yes gene_type:complete